VSLRHAILTSLLEKPTSGLELTRRFDRSIGYFWQASHQQVYRELGALEIDGLVASIPQPPSQGNRKHFKVTPRGRDELISWVARLEEPRPNRDPLLVRLRAASVVGLGPLPDQLEAHRAAHLELRDEYIAIGKRDFVGALSESAGLQHLILRAGVELEQFWADWLERAIAEIAQMRGE